MSELAPTRIEATRNVQLSVFLSYSRHDAGFATRITTALNEWGIEAKLDTRHLPALEEWRREVVGLIQRSDTFIFVVSENSIASVDCGWELQEAVAMGKRLAPVILRGVDAQKIPPALAKIQFISFEPPARFEDQVATLVKTLLTNIAWIKEHTRLADRARLWRERNENADLLLRGQGA